MDSWTVSKRLQHGMKYSEEKHDCPVPPAPRPLTELISSVFPPSPGAVVTLAQGHGATLQLVGCFSAHCHLDAGRLLVVAVIQTLKQKCCDRSNIMLSLPAER